jgi:hypothetical protein
MTMRVVDPTPPSIKIPTMGHESRTGAINDRMRYSQIIAEDGISTSINTTIGDTWEERFADHQRQQSARTKKAKKVAAAETSAADQGRTAAAARARNHDRIVAAKRG